MDILIWFLVPLAAWFCVDLSTKLGKVSRRLRKLEQKVKGGQSMSRLLEELKGQKATIFIEGIGQEWEILDVDEDWVKVKLFQTKGPVTTKLLRVEDIDSVDVYRD